MKISKVLAYSLICLSMVNCARKAAEDATSSTAMEDSFESAVTSVASAYDDENNSNFAWRNPNQMKTSTAQYIWQTLIPNAQAANCQRARMATCASGVRTGEFEDCQMGAGLFSMNGSTQLQYSQSNCSLALDNDYVTRSFDYQIEGPRGGVLNVSSADHMDYRGQTIGGGGRLTKIAAGYQADILGKNKRLSVRGQERFSISVRSLQPFISNQLPREGRILSSGQLEVNHNLAGFTALMTVNNLQYTGSCCHPVAGSVTTEFSGSVTGTARLTFESCGLASLEKDGNTEAITLSYCE
jgi:hypothetical protein